MKKSALYQAVLAALLVTSSAAVLAVDEVEHNPITAPQQLSIGTDGRVTVNAVMGTLTGAKTQDLDFYSFEGTEGDVITADINGGMKPGSTERSVDTILGIFNKDAIPGTFERPLMLLRQNDDVNPITDRDARLLDFRLAKTGTYIIGVSSASRAFLLDGNGAVRIPPRLSETNLNGSYTLVLSGVTPPVQVINIDVKPNNNDKPAPFNPRAKGVVPVALLGSSEFNVLDVNQATLRFGATGDEDSSARCQKDTKDLNGDGHPDLLCHFDNERGRWSGYEHEGVVKGKKGSGKVFIGRGLLKVVPADKDD